ncbi:glycoside hydrolase family 5 protein [Novipirellula artificiosorum]|uniref:Glycoside hydrolase family 5 domain-containing protein n=1 Tax=Novipirellula artificiosorum TaxID=2528016 RepID=A0A5C6DKM9_9BACT|nr:hypothetical protein [Novipirellula artificiosorum]TWU36191.1 hypothetical protein Poly41_39450 [Novipirellula artificiosorum]
MTFPRLLLLLPLWFPFTVASAQDKVPFVLDWATHSRSAIDLSRFLDAPAGRAGFVRPKGEHFVDGEGTRIRLWGVNLGGPSCFPSHEDAEKLAESLARLGINCVRFHGLDSNWGISSIDRSGGDTSRLDETSLERFDYLFDQLRRRGIYGNINLNVFRTYGDEDGLPDPQDLGLAKWATHFYPRIIELEEKYAVDLLTHVNRYTGKSYANDPAVLVVEIVNENSLVEGWLNGKLVGHDDNSGDTWSPLPTEYAKELNRQFNAWLIENRSAEQRERFRSDADLAANAPLVLLAPSQFSSATAERFATDQEFVVDTERSFLRRMKTLIKDEVGLKSMLIGDADHNDSVNGFPHMINNALFDYADGHGYWQHPSIGKITRTKNDPMVNDPSDSTMVQFARAPIVGKPFVISETNHPYPHRYAVEGIPLLTAYAMLQDWDGVFFHEFGRAVYDNPDAIGRNGWFNLSTDPIKVAELMCSALMWHRGDVQSAKQLIVRQHTVDEIMANSRMPSWEHRPFFDDAFAKTLPLVHRTRWRLVEKPVKAEYPPSPGINDIVSDTEQLRWQGADKNRGRVTIDTPKVQATIGFQRDAEHRSYPGIRHLSVDVKNDFATVILTSLDDQPIASSKKLLLFVGDRSANEDLTWEDDFQTVANWGNGPVAIRPLQGKISLWGLQSGGPLTTTVLGSLGQPTDETWTTYAKDGGWHVLLGNPVGSMAILER